MNASPVPLHRVSARTLALVWRTDPRLTSWLALGSLVAGLLPVSIAATGERLVDAIVAASRGPAPVASLDSGVTRWLLLELALVGGLVVSLRLLGVVRALLRAKLGHRVNVLILEKAISLSLADFEDPDTYDRITRARREASVRPLSLVTRSFELVQHGLALGGFAWLLLDFSALAVLILVVAGLPSFIAETRFARDAFRLFNWRTPETREQNYLESVLARDDHAKEVKLFGIGRALLDRYDGIFYRVFAEDRALTVRRGLWGAALGLLATVAFYGAYAWIAFATVAGAMTLGAMTMYLWVFKQGQTTLGSLLVAVGGLYEDRLYLSTLFSLLDVPTDGAGDSVRAAPPAGHVDPFEAPDAPPEARTPSSQGARALRASAHRGTGRSSGAAPGSFGPQAEPALPEPDDGLRLEGVSFTYPGAVSPALDGIDLHIPRGTRLAIVGANGSGKTTLVKLLAGFHAPTRGRMRYAGLDLSAPDAAHPAWDLTAYRRRLAVIFQDFNRYQLTLGENIGAGDTDGLGARTRWQAAADKGLASPLVASFPDGFDTRLGRWFKGGRELSLGQWQKIALARAFMRPDAEILILDEPTASMDAEAELAVFSRFREVTAGRIGLVISHRFSTVRMADLIVVLEGGRIIERGTHEALVAARGRYARSYALQAAAYGPEEPERKT